MRKVKIALDIDSLLDTFKLSYNYSSSHLEEWLQASGIISPLHQELLDDVHRKITLFGDFWNEEELKINVIAFLMYLADIVKTFQFVEFKQAEELILFKKRTYS